MPNLNSLRKSGFLWQGGLVLLPVVGLAVLGLISLRQDRRAAERDAEFLAETLADSLAREVQGAVPEAINAYVHQVEAARQELIRRALPRPESTITTNANVLRLLATPRFDEYFPRTECAVRDDVLSSPPEKLELPHPPIWVLETSIAERSELERMQVAGDAGAVPSVQGGHSGNLLNSNTRAVRANAEFQAAARAADAVALLNLARRYEDVSTESGISLADLALLRALDLPGESVLDDEMINAVATRVLSHPSFLSRRLLTALETRARKSDTAMQTRIAALRSLWNMDENARALVEAGGGAARLANGVHYARLNYFFGHPETHALESREPFIHNPGIGSKNSNIAIVSEGIVESACLYASARRGLRYPDYLSIEVEMADRSVTSLLQASSHFHGRGKFKLLAEKSGTLSDSLPGNYPFSVKVWLTDPGLLYQTQQIRLILFGTLILLAATVALIGVWQLQRNLKTQLRLSEMKSNFVSSVSHELRAPIASVRLMAEGLEQGRVSEPPKQREYFRFIVQECRRLSSLIENVLDFSRIEQGRKQYEFEPADAVALAQQTVKLMQTYAAEQSIELALQIQGEPFPVEMDAKAVQQALINLIDNAIKHSPKGGNISVGLEFRSAGFQPGPAAKDATLQLWVEDHGEGIPAAEHEKIFERFYRLGSELRRETQGVGIGLSIVKHIVEAHGGAITVRSAPGEGSRFTIELPEKKCAK